MLKSQQLQKGSMDSSRISIPWSSHGHKNPFSRPLLLPEKIPPTVLKMVHRFSALEQPGSRILSCQFLSTCSSELQSSSLARKNDPDNCLPSHFHRGNESPRNQMPVPSRSPSGKATEPKVTVEVGPVEGGHQDLPILLCKKS